jgi:hypothetical protein
VRHILGTQLSHIYLIAEERRFVESGGVKSGLFGESGAE